MQGDHKEYMLEHLKLHEKYIEKLIFFFFIRFVK